jgi:hypothetical protein
LEATLTQQQQQIETPTAQLKEQAAQIQKVNAQIEMRKPAAKMHVNKLKAVPSWRVRGFGPDHVLFDPQLGKQ